MSAQGLETALARLYTDPAFREAFLADSESALSGADLTAGERAALTGADRAGLVMAARSFRMKREGYARRRAGRLWVRLTSGLSRLWRT